MDRISCVIVDDDESSVKLLSDYCQKLPYVDIAGRFVSPTKFIELLPALNFDLCVLDINMPVINGLKVAQQLKGKPIIFVTGEEKMLKDALDFSPIDIVIKPFRKERLDNAFSKAYLLHGDRKKVKRGNEPNQKEYGLFNIEGLQGKFKLKLADILFVHSDTNDSRHKKVIMRNGSIYKIMDCNFEKLLAVSPHLVRVNGSQMISLELVQNYKHNSVSLLSPVGDKQIKELSLNRTFRQDFRERMTAWL